MIRTFLSDDDHAALLRALDTARIDAGIATEVLNAAEEAACTLDMLRLFKLGIVRPQLAADGRLEWPRVQHPFRLDHQHFARAVGSESTALLVADGGERATRFPVTTQGAPPALAATAPACWQATRKGRLPPLTSSARASPARA
jgi:hypothetical protein